MERMKSKRKFRRRKSFGKTKNERQAWLLHNPHKMDMLEEAGRMKGHGGMGCKQLAKDNIQWQGFINAGINPWVLQKQGSQAKSVISYYFQTLLTKQLNRNTESIILYFSILLHLYISPFYNIQ
jgi:hypothetical protein